MELLSLNLAPPSKRTELPMGAQYSLGTLSSMLTGVRTNSGQFVTPERAMRSAAVLACIHILCSDLASLPLNLFRRTSSGAALATDHPLFRLLQDAPNQWQTSMELRESMILDVLCFGQSFTEKIIGPDGISRLYPLSAGRMIYENPLSMYLPADPPLLWRYADPHVGQRIFLSDDLWTVRMLAPGGTINGQSLILLAREAIGLALAAEEQGARLFAQGVQTDLVLETTAEEVDVPTQRQLRKEFTRRHSGSGNAWMPMILSGGLSAKRIGLTAQESQYIETRAFQLQDIARIFRIPEVLLGISQGKSATYASAEQFFLAYTKYCLGPWCRRIEQSITRDLLAESETDLFAKHDLDSLTRADLQTRYAAHAAGITAGFLTRNEARQMENLPTLPGLDEPLSPLNMGSGNLKPAQGAGARLAQQLARNAVAHESKLLADGKSAADVYMKLLPGYLTAKTGLSPSKCGEYCAARMAQPDSDGIELLTEMLTQI
jgi:HK97 family phage portal protein